MTFWAFLLQIATTMERFPRVQRFHYTKVIIVSYIIGAIWANIGFSGNFSCKNNLDYGCKKKKIKKVLNNKGAIWENIFQVISIGSPGKIPPPPLVSIIDAIWANIAFLVIFRVKTT